MFQHCKIDLCFVFLSFLNDHVVCISTHGWDMENVALCIEQLQSKGLVKSLEHGAFTRVGQADSEIQVCQALFLVSKKHV